MRQNITFITFGMFILDEIQHLNSSVSRNDLVGGAGAYAALGARLVAGAELARTVSWIVDMGSDFPSAIRDQIESWEMSTVFREDLSRQTTRGWNGYGEHDHRAFKYLTPKRRLEVDNLSDLQTLSESAHMVCKPSRCIDLVSRFNTRRRALQEVFTDAIMVWEPIPDLCTPAELETLQRAASHVTVVSPNAEELAQFFPSQSLRQTEMVRLFMGWDRNQNLSTSCIIREGANGSTVYFAPAAVNMIESDKKKCASLHLSAYHDGSTATCVLDPTGGGNTYLGALAIGMTKTMSDMTWVQDVDSWLFTSPSEKLITFDVTRLVKASIFAVVAAGYAIEQYGMPVLAEGIDQDKWNGDRFESRLKLYLHRDGGHIKRQLYSLSLS